MKIKSNDLEVSESSHVLFVSGNPNNDYTCPVRWDPGARQLEYQQGNQWFRLPQPEVTINLPSDLTEVVNWARQNRVSVYDRPLTDLLNWVKQQKQLMAQHHQMRNSNPALADAWDRVVLALDQYQMLLELSTGHAA